MTQNDGQPDNPEDIRRSTWEQRGGVPLVSVVIPCYKQAHFLGEAIESVLAQSHPRFEVIVVDDGSPDNTSEVAARYPGVRCIRQENQGLSGARNTGLSESKGSYVVFLDADDRLLPRALEAGLECFEAHPECAFVYGDYRVIAVNGSVAGKSRQRVVGKDRYLGLLQDNYITMHATVMYRRDVFDLVGGFDTSVNGAEDYDMYLRIARRFPIYGHGRLVAEYRGHDANMSYNSALMLINSVSVLRAQRKYAKTDKPYRKAYATGMGLWKGWYGDPLVSEVRACIRAHDWRRVLRGALVLARYHPRGLALLLLNEQRMQWHMEQRRLARGLLVRERELKVRRQRLKVRRQQLRKPEGTQEFEGTLVNERQEVKRLSRSIRRLQQQVRKLDQRAQSEENNKIWKLSQRLGQGPAGASRK
jgi:glycosyltransferase involved in cell wall biosynthesis